MAPLTPGVGDRGETADVSGCVFCEIARGQMPASVIYRNDLCMALMDIHPISRGHVLVIPLEHRARLGDIEKRAQEELFAVANRILEAQRSCGLAKEGANLMLNDGAAANQHIAHVHVHLVPRVRGDRLKTAARLVARMLNVFGRRSPSAELDALASDIKKHLTP